jgi:hypothetical protein
VGNGQIAQDLFEDAEADWGRYGVQRFRWEQKFRDPQDVLKEAERVRKRLAQKARPKRGKAARRLENS